MHANLHKVSLFEKLDPVHDVNDLHFSQRVSLTQTSPSYRAWNLRQPLWNLYGYTARRVNFWSKHGFVNSLTQNLKNLKIFIPSHKSNHF